MGSLNNRGTRDNPQWYVRYRDVDGRWKQKHSKQAKRDDAAVVLAEIEARVRRGMVGVPE